LKFESRTSQLFTLGDEFLTTMLFEKKKLCVYMTIIYKM